MPADVHLLLHNIGSIISGIVALSVAVFTYFNNPKKTVNVALALTNLCAGIFCISHVIGVNIADPHISKLVLMFNLSVIFTVIFTLHTVFAIINIQHTKRRMLYFIYALGVGLTIFYILFPDTFILDSVPKLYFPNYYVAGSLHWLMRVLFQLIIPIYLIIELLIATRKNTNPIERNRSKYFMVTMIIGYTFGLLPLPLIFWPTIWIDPMWGMWFVPWYTIPLVYAIVTYELVDIKVVARKAFLYGISVVGVSTAITLFNFSNEWVARIYPGFPFWIIPLISSVLAVGVGFFVWEKLREGELMKYEFITVVTHKFRTPLTHIKWAAENLSKSNLPADDKNQIDYIQSANDKLVELTGLLMNVSEAESSAYGYHVEKSPLAGATEDIIASLKNQIDTKHLTIVRKIEPDLQAMMDISRLKFVIQVFIENAVHYTPEHGTITVAIYGREKDLVFSVSDTGIGLTKEEVPLIFSKFYRGKQAKLADTEGMGIGLFISKEVLARHRGRIWAESTGPHQGSTFSFSLPRVK